MAIIKNPILPGFYPDPSIIRVDDDFYIVNSSFEYFPSIPIWHSKDLIHWKQIGNVIDRENQLLELSDVMPSGGVQAATIRYHEGTYYVTSTRVKKEWPRKDYHFIVTSQQISGPWSSCHYIQEAEGIDSSLFFDGEKAYFLANREKMTAKSGSDTEIWMREIDLLTYQLVGPTYSLWDGTGGIYPEGPRLFKRHGFYYLLIAEGGTLHNHTVTMARSESLTGPYVSVARNPLLTHKHLAREYPIQNVGHADLVELSDGSWVGVCLGSRPQGGFYDGGNIKYSFGGYYRNLGRETFLFPVIWPSDNASPLLSPSTGKLEFMYELPNLKSKPTRDIPLQFSQESLNVKWVSIRNELRNHYSLLKENHLLLQLQATIEDTFLGIRQTSWNFMCSVEFDGSTLSTGDHVGLAAYIKEGTFLSLEIEKKDIIEISINSTVNHQKTVAKTVATNSNNIHVILEGNSQDYTFQVNELNLSATLDGRVISCDMNDAHTGVMIALIGKSTSQSTVGVKNFTYRIR